MAFLLFAPVLLEATKSTYTDIITYLVGLSSTTKSTYTAILNFAIGIFGTTKSTQKTFFTLAAGLSGTTKSTCTGSGLLSLPGSAPPTIEKPQEVPSLRCFMKFGVCTVHCAQCIM